MINVSESERLLTTAQAARELGLSRRTLARYAAEGLLTPTVTLGGLRRSHYKWRLDGPDGLRAQLRELGRRRERGE